MAAPSDSPADPETGAIVDPEVLADRRARRAEPSEPGHQERAQRAERLVVTLGQRLEEAEAQLAAAQHELDEPAGGIEDSKVEPAATQQPELASGQARSGSEQLREALQVVEEEQRRAAERLAQAEAERSAREHALRAADRRLVDQREALRVAERRLVDQGDALRVAERQFALQRAALHAAEGLLVTREQELHALRAGATARREAELHAEAARARAASLERELTEERAQRTALEAFVEFERARSALELGEAEVAVRTARSDLEADVRAPVVLGLVADLVVIARGLREGFARALAAITAERDAQLADERRVFAVELAAAVERAAAAGAENERLRAREAGNAIYDRRPAGSQRPDADHPALAQPPTTEGHEAPQPPAVVLDLSRAMDRLRAASDERSLRLVADPNAGPEVEPIAGPDLDAREPVAAPEPPEPEREAVEGPQPGAQRPAHDRVDPIARAEAPTARSWFGRALIGLAAVDAASAERLLVAALPVQAGRVSKDVTYELDLAVTGRHHVHVERGGGVVVSPGDTEPRRAASFELAGRVESLVALGAGGAPRRLSGVAFSGRRRHLRRLLRSLAKPVSLRELEAAGARPRPGDLLAMLCLRVPADVVRGADFSVAYVIADAGSRQIRTLVRAEPDGSLVAIPEALDAFPADATVAVDAAGLLGVLGGTTSVTPTGDAQAVTTLQRWLFDVQGIPA